jgi:hypothetical protein
MTNKKRAAASKSDSGKPGSATWKIIAVISIVFSAGLFAKTLFFTNEAPKYPPQTASQSSSSRYVTSPLQLDEGIEKKVQLVASNFRCACGGCGELPLAECQCDMPRGAVEEKGFIRNKLKGGYTVDQVIAMVDKTYGLKNK